MSDYEKEYGKIHFDEEEHFDVPDDIGMSSSSSDSEDE
jgi:hypothetical protein